MSDFPPLDHPYILAFSLMMLHTDAFNKSNKKKMTKADYVKNTRLTGVPPEVLDVRGVRFWKKTSTDEAHLVLLRQHRLRSIHLHRRSHGRQRPAGIHARRAACP